MTDKQRRFVEEYCVDFNATQAAIRAGYGEETAASDGSENLRRPNVRAAIQDRCKELTMGPGETAVRLTRFGRGTAASSMDEDGLKDITPAEALEALDLIRKINRKEIDALFKKLGRMVNMEKFEELLAAAAESDASDGQG